MAAEAFLAELQTLDLPAEWCTQVVVSERRNTVALRVDEYAHLVVTVPAGADPGAVLRAVRRQTMWVCRQVRQRQPYVPDHPVKELVSGEGFRLFGLPHRLRVVDGGPPLLCDETTRLSTWSGSPIREIHLRRDHADGPDALIGWFSGQGREWMADATGARSLVRWCRRLGVEPPTFEVATLKPRQWAVHRKARRTLTAHWALFQLDPAEIEFALMRELVKTVAPTAAEARTRVAGLFCDHITRADRLAKEGRRVWLGDVQPERGAQ